MAALPTATQGPIAFIPTLDGSNVAGTSGNPLVMSLANTKLRVVEQGVSPAPGATVHAGIAGGAPLAVTTAFTQIQRPTNIRLSRSGAGVATVYTLTGTRFGATQSEQIASSGASDVESTKVYDVVTSLTSDVDPTVTTTVKTGVILGTSNVFDSIEFAGTASAVGANHAVETVTPDAAKDGYTPAVAPDGTKEQYVRYVIKPTTTQP